MKLSKKFILSSLEWRGLKTSSSQLIQLSRFIPDVLTREEYTVFLCRHFGLPRSMAERWVQSTLEEWSWIENNNINISTVFDHNFPSAFSDIEDAPKIVTYWGDLNGSDAQCISIVGTRNPSRFAIEWMESELDAFLKVKTQVTVVSGGAHGVDQKAHFLALRNNRATICLAPSGLARLYPKDLLMVKSEVIRVGGAIISTLSPFAEMQKRFFIERNRYIANWSPLTFVVEAKRRSGTMITARWVKLLERQLTVLPCAPLTPGMGGLDLLIDGGALGIRDRYDLSQAFESALVAIRPGPIVGAGKYL